MKGFTWVLNPQEKCTQRDDDDDDDDNMMKLL